VRANGIRIATCEPCDDRGRLIDKDGRIIHE
jgi:predicted RNA-binding protein YlqC (UPF0109 family)